MNPIRRLAACAALALLLPAHAHASAGGEEGPPDFNSPWGPVRPLAEIASGSLGVVESSWWRKPLLLAWYRFNALPLPANALDAFRYQDRMADNRDVPLLGWRAEVQAAAPDLVPAAAALPDTELPYGNAWDMFMNCPGAAWEQARKTMAARSRAWGAGSPALRDWITAQHRVFARCRLGPTYFREDLLRRDRWNGDLLRHFLLPDMAIPDAPRGAPTLLVQDRSYQRASALLYEGRYAEAESAFQAIAQDVSSPWREWGRYEALRARLRAVQITPRVHCPAMACDDARCQIERDECSAYRRGEAARLRADIARAVDAARKAGNAEETRRLVDLSSLVGARLDPAQRFRELAADLQRPGLDAETFKAAATDYIHLHRQFPPSEPLGEWLSGLIDARPPTDVTSCKGGKSAADLGETPESRRCLGSLWSRESFARFQAHRTQFAWLFSAAALADPRDTHVGALLKALAEIPTGHPGETTFLLQRLRLSGRDEALPLAEALLQRPDVVADYSARNRVHQYRLSHATSLREFWNDAMREIGVGYDRDTLLPSAPPAAPVLGWDFDAQWILNYELPHAALMETARASSWPEDRRLAVAQMAWARAQLRKDAGQAREALALAASFGNDSLASHATRLAAIADDQAFLLESGVLPSGIAPPAKIGGNCRVSAPRNEPQYYQYAEATPGFDLTLGQFAGRLLSTAEQAQWRAERSQYDKLPDLASLRMQNILDFAARFPDDARVPALLREAVYATRMNWCADKSAGRLSKQAFDLLKHRYPKSSAARATKYWFKPGF